MINRDEYVTKLKSQLDQWNTEVAKWEAQAKTAQAGVQAEYQKQLQQYRSRRDEALAQLRKVQSASAEAWSDMMRGTDDAWKKMQEAFNQARSRFDKK
jgi:lipid II:glycine glycyltransferase (peptidoglycan interpeptide bridge formation enzyme)